MNIYEKLINLAANPCNNRINLLNEEGKKLNTSRSVLKILNNEISSSDKSSIDLRQACETKIFEF